MKTKWQLSMAIALVLLLVSSVISCSTPAPTPEATGAGQMDTTTNQLVVEVDENGLSINKNRFNTDSTLDDYIRVLGSPSRVTELMNTIHTYDDAGIMLYHPPHSNEITQVSIDFNRGDYEFSPTHTFQGVLTVSHLSVDSNLHSDSLKSIPNLIAEDLEFGVCRSTLGSVILHFRYGESRQSLDSLAISFSEAGKESTTPAEPTPIEDGWVRILIEDVGSIDYPSDFLELQSEEYIEMGKETIGKEAYEVLLGKSDFTLQQVGLNDLLPSAFNEYRRVIFRTDYLNPGEEVFKANEKYTMSREELAEFQNELMTSYDENLQG